MVCRQKVRLIVGGSSLTWRSLQKKEEKHDDVVQVAVQMLGATLLPALGK